VARRTRLRSRSLTFPGRLPSACRRTLPALWSPVEPAEVGRRSAGLRRNQIRYRRAEAAGFAAWPTDWTVISIVDLTVRDRPARLNGRDDAAAGDENRTRMTSVEGRPRQASTGHFRLRNVRGRHRRPPPYAVLNGPLMAHHGCAPTALCRYQHARPYRGEMWRRAIEFGIDLDQCVPSAASSSNRAWSVFSRLGSVISTAPRRRNGSGM
jgi:hypothetical protein